MMQQLVLLPDQPEDVVFFGAETRRSYGEKWFVLEIRTVQGEQMP
jgi:hypothetical protein